MNIYPDDIVWSFFEYYDDFEEFTNEWIVENERKITIDYVQRISAHIKKEGVKDYVSRSVKVSRNNGCKKGSNPSSNE